MGSKCIFVRWLFIFGVMIPASLFAKIKIEGYSFPHVLVNHEIQSRLKIPNKLIILDSNIIEIDFTLSEIEPVKSLVIGKALFYPNPFRLEEGADLGYFLSKNMDIEIRIYNMRAQEIYRDYFMAGHNGGLGRNYGYNRIYFGAHSFAYNISAGVYVYLVMHAETVLAKGKFVIKP